MHSNMVKLEKFDHLHLVNQFIVPLKPFQAAQRSVKIKTCFSLRSGPGREGLIMKTMKKKSSILLA